jgi:small subunit ribosomal protein S35
MRCDVHSLVDASIVAPTTDHRPVNAAFHSRNGRYIHSPSTDSRIPTLRRLLDVQDASRPHLHHITTLTTMATPLRQACRKAPTPFSQLTSRAFSTTKSTCASQLTPDPEVLPPINLESLPSQAHADIETHREIRALARKAAWEMPLLGSLSKPFTPPTQATPLRWRYTTYMGEAHPASKKVVVEFAPADLPDLNEKQKLKLIKLAGARWSPAKETVRMSCESQAQNKRFLGETIGKLLAEAKDHSADSFEDLPLDLRHVENKRMQRKQKALHRVRLGNPNTGFPVEWRMTEERRAELDARRNAQIEAPAVEQAAAEGAEGEAKVEATQAKKAVSGIDAIEEARKIDLTKVEEPLMAEARAPIAAGKQGKKQFGQTARK